MTIFLGIEILCLNHLVDPSSIIAPTVPPLSQISAFHTGNIDYTLLRRLFCLWFEARKPIKGPKDILFYGIQ